MKTLVDNDETKYIKSLVDPFHPDSTGVRIPSSVPRETLTYQYFSEAQVQGAQGDFFFMTATEAVYNDKTVMIQGPGATNMINNVIA